MRGYSPISIPRINARKGQSRDDPTLLHFLFTLSILSHFQLSVTFRAPFIRKDHPDIA